jgi:DNA-directed RNA polymerase subunit RPC12/RpoP
MKKTPFTCPACKNVLGFKNVIKIADGRDFKCPHCGSMLTPKLSKTWRWGFLIGSISVVVPAKIYLAYFQDNIFVALLIGAAFGAAAVLGICVYVFKHTIFHLK